MTILDLIKDWYGEGGVKACATDLKLPYMTLNNALKRANHNHLVAFMDCADELGIGADLLLPILDVNPEDRKDWLTRALEVETPTIRGLVPGGDASNYLYRLLMGVSGRQIKRIYRPLARKFSLTIEELYEAIVAGQTEAA